jgi:hypothetical protein
MPSSEAVPGPRVAGEEERVDPELLELPPPPRGERRKTLAMLVLAAVASAAMAAALTRDAAYALRSSSVVDLGDLTATPTSAFVSNRLAQGVGRLSGVGALRYERPFESDSYRVAPVAGRPDIWVELRVPPGEESNRYEPKTEFAGRLVRFADAGLRHRGLRSAIEERTGQAVPPNAYLLVDGQTPSESRAYAVLWLMFLSFALWNVATILRLVRRLR